MIPDLKNFTRLAKLLEVKEGGLTVSMQAAEKWLREIGAESITKIPPIRCSTSEPETLAVKFKWHPLLLEVVVWPVWNMYPGRGFVDVSIQCSRAYESKEHMMRSLAQEFIKRGRHKLDRLDDEHMKLLPLEVQERVESECCKTRGGAFK